MNGERLTPDMLPLVRLTADEIAHIVAAVPGGASNVQDVYPLASLQSGVLFHHLLESEGDPYLWTTLMSFDSREHLDRYLRALRGVVARHDILRTAVVWEGLREPVQVVLRHVEVPVEELPLDPQDGDVASQLSARFHPRQFRIDLRQAPMLRLYVTNDRAQQRWLLLLARHHLTGDHASQGLMQQEIEAHLLGLAQALPAPVQFRDFVARSRVNVDDHEAYFAQLLADVKEPTAPFQLMDVRRDGSGIARACRAVDERVAQRVREQARRLRVSPSTLCHVAWGLVLARACGRDDVVFGTVLLGRMQAWEAVRGVIGMFVNTLPVRVRLKDAPVAAVVRETHRQLSGLLRHEQAPLSLVQRCSQVAAPAPLFSALLNYRLAINGDDAGADRAAAWDGIRTLSVEQPTSYPLTLTVEDQRKGFYLIADVDSSVDPSRVCGYMHRALESLIEAVETGSEVPARTLQVIPDDEREEILVRWNSPATEDAPEQCIHELLEAQARSTPAAAAVEDGPTAVSFGELNVRANRLAHYLRARGIGPDARVAVRLDPGIDMVVATLAVLKAGAACVPIDEAWGAERLRLVLEDSAPAALLTRNDERALSVPADEVAIVDIGAAIAASSGRPDTNLDPGDRSSTDLAYVAYTDWSTASPRGAMIEHRTIARLSTVTRRCGFMDSDVVAWLHSSGSDVSLWEMWAALLCGARLVVVPRVSASPDATYHFLCDTGATILHQRAAELRRFLNSQDSAARPHRLRHVVLHDDTLPRGLFRRWCERIDTTATRLLRTFGGAEATALGSHVEPSGRDESPVAGAAARLRPCDTRVYILDGDRQPVPVGVVGDVYVGGSAVARGYWRRPELTAQRFLHDAFVEHSSARMYRTGDRARWWPDGTIALAGRTESHVAIHGCEVELETIAARLEECDGVTEALVLVADDMSGAAQLIGYYTSAGPQEATPEALRAQLSAALPGYMVPSAFVQMNAFPLASDGRVDRAALPDLCTAGTARWEHEPPAGDIEEKVAQIWAEVLKVERIDRRDNFFELNGHSLLAVQVVTRVRQAFDVELALDDLLDQPIFAAFVERLASLLIEQLDDNELGTMVKWMREGV